MGLNLNHAAIGATALVLVFAAHELRERLPIQVVETNNLQAPNPTLVNILTLGHRRLAADLIWLDALQYFGGTAGARHQYARMPETLEAVVDLDPDFKYIYIFGGITLTTTLEGVAAADHLLSRCIDRFPDEWRCPFYLGFNAYIYLDDPQRAARYVEQAAKLPDAPSFLASWAVKVLTTAGLCDRSIEMLDSIAASTRDELTRQNLAEHRRHVVWECNLQIVETATASFKQRLGRAPASIQELTTQGALPRTPPDPYGGQYYIDGQGQAASTTRKKRLKIELPADMKEQLRQW